MNSKKRLLVIVLCVLVTVMCVIGIVACNNKKNEDCSHAWGEWSVKTDASCTVAGVREQTCTRCGETKEEAIPALGHVPGETTCGVRAKCERCKLPCGDAPEHVWNNATCTTPKTCSVCLLTEGNALGHTGGNATCATAEYCTVCGEIFGSTLEHTGGTASCQDKATCELCGTKYGELGAHAWTNATCTAPKTCSVCSLTEGNALGHTGGTATCSKKAECTVCGEEYGSFAAHDWVDATCSSLETCSHCGETRGDIADHSWTAATCTTPKTCSVCSITEGEALGHSYGETVVDPTCLEKGYTLHTCSACGDAYKDNETDAKGHDWSRPTCAHERTCSGCDETEDALLHNYELSGSRAATCTSPKIDTYTCYGCGDSYTDDVGSELGHNLSGVTPTEEKVAGTTCDYVQIYKCKTCSEDVEGDRVSHHDYIAKVTTEATCVADGVKTLTCKDCGHVTTEKIEKTTNAHIWNEGTLSGNIRTYSCINGCSATKTAVDATAEESAKVNASDLAAAGGVDLKGASMSLDETTLGAVKNKDLTLSAGTLSGDELTAAKNLLTPEQQEQLGENPIYNFTMNDGSGNITSFNGGFITITIPYSVPDGEDVDSVAIWYISEGTPVCIEAEYSNGYVTFQTDHFSFYSVTRLTPEERCQVYGHNIRETVVEATCIKDGYTLEVCIRCAQSNKTNIVTAPGHDYTTTENAATCTSAGNIIYACACGYSYKTKLVATGHAWTVVEKVDATCAVAGYTKSVCDKCSSEYVKTQAQLRHTYVESTIIPTCQTNGYTVHTCSGCGDEYKDNMIVAYGHSYESTWKWSSDYSTATLVSVCVRDEAHTAETAATITSTSENATCSREGYVNYSAQAIFGGAIYRDSKTQTIEKLPHTYGGELSSSQTSHWYTCTVCSAKGESNAHTFGAEEITKAASCTEEGVSKQTCAACGYEKTQSIPMVAHSYDTNGSCTVCGHFSGDCDHSATSTTISINLSDYGCCGSTLTVNTCACGEKYYVNDMDDVGGMCDFEYTYGDTNTKEDGTMYATMYAECKKCGFKMDVYAEAVQTGCYMKATYDCTFSINGETIIEHVFYIEEDEYHNRKETTIVIENSVCGNISISASACADCGKIGYINSTDMSCRPSGGEQGEYTDENGNIHEYYRGTCSKCGFMFVEEEWFEIDGCIEIEYELMYIEVNGERVFEYADDYRSSNHEYEYEYTLQGKTCLDGVNIKRTCTICGTISSYTTSGHESIPQDTYDISEYGGCGGNIYTYSCACGMRNGITYYDVECDYHYLSVPSNPDKNENKHDISIMACDKCGLRIERESYTVSEGCYDCVHATFNVKVGETVIISNLEAITDYYDNHKYDYTFEMNGSSCLDGYMAHGICTVCGYEIEEKTYGHNQFCIINYSLADFGACGGYVKVYSCPCGENRRVERGFDCKEWLCDGEREYTDGEGITHYVETYKCATCGFTRVCDKYRVIEGCIQKEYAIWTLSIGDKILVDGLEEDYGYYENHKYEYTFNLNGSSCEDGYYVTARCTVCGYSYERENQWHESYEVAYHDFAKFGACNGSIRIRACACGEMSNIDFYYDCNFEWGKNEEYTDGNGNVHYVEVGTCNTCGFQITADYYSEKIGCYEYRYVKYTGVKNGSTVIDVSGCSERGTVHNYEYNFEMFGSSCEDGYRVHETCRNCGESTSYESNYHQTFRMVHYDFSEYGSCGGYFNVYSCACGQKNNINLQTDCEYQSSTEKYPDENGVIHYVITQTCPDCGLEIVVDSQSKKEGCKINEYAVVSASINGSQIFSDISGIWSYTTDHDYEYTYEMYGSTCEDGYREYAVCRDCGYSYENESSWHWTNTFEKYYLYEYGCCGGYIEKKSCPCGRNQDFQFSVECDYTYYYDDYTDESGVRHSVLIYECEDCGLLIKRDYYTAKEGCWYNDYYVYEVSVGNTTVFSDYAVISSSWESHQYEYSFVLYGNDCEDGYVATGVCRNCGATTEIEGSGHNTYYVVNVDLKELGACGGYIEANACACNKYEYFGYNVDCNFESRFENVMGENGEVRRVEIITCFECGLELTYTSYRETEGCYTYTHRVYTASLGGEEIVPTFDYIYDTYENHNTEYTFQMNGSSCEDGYFVNYRCADCGYEWSEEMNWHCTFAVNEYQLSDIGACGGHVTEYSCPCGYMHYAEYGTVCDDTRYNEEKYYDDDKLVTVSVLSCNRCGLRIQESHYELRDSSTCTATTYYTLVVSANGGALEPLEYTSSSTSHDYKVTGKLMEGSKDCNDGAIMTGTCLDCGDSYTQDYYWHGTFTAEKINLFNCGSVCGGYAYYSKCSCGYVQTMNINNVTCDFDRVQTKCWIDGILNKGQPTVDGDMYFGSNACIYTCAVTDVQCAFKIRMTEYWMEVPGECRAQRYVTWQFGYNPETGGCGREITYTNGTATYHRYTETDINESNVTGTEYKCSCGSSYTTKTYTDSNGNIVKYEQIAINTLDDGANKRREYVTEYSYYNGDRYISREYSRTVYASGKEYWTESIYTKSAYSADFGTDSYKKIETRKNSNGENIRREYAVTYYKGYDFYLYEYYTDNTNGQWEKRDYTYSFSGGCKITERYRNSDGEDVTQTQDNHRSTYYTTTKQATCTQDGEYYETCYICEKKTYEGTYSPNGHNWVGIDGNYYFCSECGLENINGADGSIVLEDLTAAYGNGTNYVIGYWKDSQVDFIYCVGIVIKSTGEDIFFDEIAISESNAVRAKVFAKAEVERLASALGYSADEYYVTFAFVPVGGDGTLDYSITLTEDEVHSGNVTDDLTEKICIEGGSAYRYTITPTESGTWTFTSNAVGDPWAQLLDEESSCLEWDDDDGEGYNFYIEYWLEAGKTYYFEINQSSSQKQYMHISIDRVD